MALHLPAALLQRRHPLLRQLLCSLLGCLLSWQHFFLRLVPLNSAPHTIGIDAATAEPPCWRTLLSLTKLVVHFAYYRFTQKPVQENFYTLTISYQAAAAKQLCSLYHSLLTFTYTRYVSMNVKDGLSE